MAENDKPITAAEETIRKRIATLEGAIKQGQNDLSTVQQQMQQLNATLLMLNGALQEKKLDLQALQMVNLPVVKATSLSAQTAPAVAVPAKLITEDCPKESAEGTAANG